MDGVQAQQTRSREAVRDAVLKKHLLARRQKLHEVLPGAPRTSQLLELLQDVDAALARMDVGVFGICDTCHEDIGHDQLLNDPLCRNCLDHLSAGAREALQRDLDLAYQVQTGLLPKDGLSLPGWKLAYHYEPLGPVSGDYCDIIPLGDESALFLVGDVMGKGVAASMFMAQLHGIFRSLATPTVCLASLLEKANRVFCEGTLSAFFATVVCGRIAPDGAVEICNAGHCRPLHVGRERIDEIDSTGLPLGLVSEADYEAHKLQLSAGESLIVYTDGLVESFNSAGEQYGADQLARLLGRRQALEPKALLSACVEDASRFRASAPRTDDLTVMALRRE